MMTYPRFAYLFASLSLLALPALVGCDSSDDEDVAGSFQLEVSGALEDAYSGRAAFARETDPETGEVFAIGLFNAQDEQDVVVLVGKGAPARKTYEVSTEETGEAAAFYAVRLQAEEGAFFMADGGTFTLTDVRSDRLEGRLEITAVSVLDETQTITLSGTFDAEQGEVEGGLDTL